MMKKISLLLTIAFFLTVTGKQADAQWSYDSVSFEMPTNKIVIDTSNGNLWQIGAPQKTFFSDAHSGMKAILTDTINDYPPNDTSSFIYIIRNPYTQSCYTSMEFWHRYDMDSTGDKGIIEASYDGGSSWIQVDDTSFLYPMDSYFWWEADYHESSGDYTDHPVITSGKSDGWIKSIFSWQWWIPVRNDTVIINPDSLMIRFTFISDSIIKNKEGWMIDDIVTSSAWWQICSSVNELTCERSISVFPNPFTSQATLRTDLPWNHASLRIYNSFGQTVRQMTDISGNTVILFREDLPGGLYFLLMTEGGKAFAMEKLFIMDLGR